MLRTMRRYKIPQKTTTDMNSIRKCIVSGLFPNAAYLHMSGDYRTIRGDIPLKIHPSSVLYTVTWPPYLVYTEIIHSKNVFMRDVTAIDPLWLEILAPHFYQKNRIQRNIF